MGSDLASRPVLRVLRHFNPRSPHGERLIRHVRKITKFRFQSTLPAWGATSVIRILFITSCNFNPRSPHGERQPQFIIDSYIEIFQSTLPAWGATGMITRPPAYYDISIHAPRMGSDPQGSQRENHCQREISIHAPRMGSDHSVHVRDVQLFIFQSTLPAWGATSTRKGTR